MHGAQTITRLWESVSTYPEIGTFERFVLALDLLYLIGVVDMRDGLLLRPEKEGNERIRYDNFSAIQ
jgi:hypothetical protein